MALVKTALPLRNEDGSQHHHYASDAGLPLVYTGPHIVANVTAPDGTVHDCTDLFTEVASEEAAGHLSHAVGLHHEEHGHPAHGDPSHPEHVPFVHLCTAACGPHARPLAETLASFEARAQTGHPDHADRVAFLTAQHAHVNPGA